jgi:hypothetical protein
MTSTNMLGWVTGYTTFAQTQIQPSDSHPKHFTLMTKEKDKELGESYPHNAVQSIITSTTVGTK